MITDSLSGLRAPLANRKSRGMITKCGRNKLKSRFGHLHFVIFGIVAERGIVRGLMPLLFILIETFLFSIKARGEYSDKRGDQCRMKNV